VTIEASSRPVLAYPFGEPDRLLLHPMYALLRAEQPLARVRMAYGDPAWLITGYHNARAVWGDPRLRRDTGHDEPRMTPEIRFTNLMSIDPPEHSRLRRLVAKAFTAARVEQLRARTQRVADELVDAMVRTGPPADLVNDFAVPLPATVMCELLGVPVADRQRFHRWVEVVVSATSLSAGKIREYNARLGRYIAGLIRQRRSEPSDTDLLGALVQARDSDDRLSEQELVNLVVLLLGVGFETTSTEIPNFVYVLLTEAGAWDQLRAQPSGAAGSSAEGSASELSPVAVEELTRYVPIISYATFPRYAVEDVSLDGGVVRAGEAVLVHQAAANRDERVFADPDRLDFTRSPNPHLSFGHGPHHCLGAPLARMELQVGLATLLRRLPELRLATVEEEIPWKRGLSVRGPSALPVTW
jgi:cytochrome P450